MNATINLENKHFPVLLNELISIISPLYGGTFIDCTFGQGGYSEKILENKKNNIIAIDRDKDVLSSALKLQKKFKTRLKFYNIKFSQLNKIKLKDNKIKGIIFDLGYSYSQIKDPQKGLSFNSTGNLNMQLGLNEFSAKDAINNLESKELEKIFKFFGEEQEAKRITYSIVKEREKREINTETLVELIEKSKRKKNFKIHNATKVFQALRIFVNKEVSELINGLIAASRVLNKDGVLAVVTFHSLEDKIVKYFFKSLSEKKSVSRYVPKIEQPETLFSLVKKKPITPSIKEIKENIPSRSAKLRYVIKKRDFYDFNTDIFKKFKTLLEIENFGKKL